MDPAFWFMAGFFTALLFVWTVSGAAYRNGVTDGFGYAMEPNCPGYRKAGEYLKKHMAHRWPELNDSELPDELS